MNSIIKSSFLQYYNSKTYYEDMSKFASLGMWVLNGLGADIDNIEKLIGEYPSINDNKKIDRELTEEDLNWIEFAKKNNLQYKITEEGIKLG